MTRDLRHELTRRKVLLQTLSLAALHAVPDFIRQCWAGTLPEASGLPSAILGFSPPGSNRLTPSSMDMTQSACGQFRAEGERIYLRGIVCGENGRALQNVRVLLLQPAANGSHRHPGYASWEEKDPGFRYQGLCHTDRLGRFEFLTVLPGTPSGAGRGPYAGAGAVLVLSLAGYSTRIVRRSRRRIEATTRSPGGRPTFNLTLA